MSSLPATFQHIDGWLRTHQPLWKIDTFVDLDIPWKGNYPELAHYLACIRLAERDADRKADLIEHFPFLAPCQTWLRAPSLSRIMERDKAVPSYFSVGIKGRKWQQITAFANVTPIAEDYLEWCAGKGHLGKLLAFQGNKKVHSLEWQQSLCDAGKQDAERLNLRQTFSHADVLKGEGRSALANAHCAVALHACGDLHLELIKQAVAAKTLVLCLSPCCYHLTKDEFYQPLSKTAQQSPLILRQADLKLAVKEVATAGVREQRLKQLELTYRLGFDSWQRAARQQDDYLPVPSVQKAILTQGFDAFCHWSAKQKGLTDFIASNPFSEFEPIGEARAKQVQKLETISQLFRPALEYWLILDRAMYLEENGYQVEIGTFCEKSLTPRNWMIRATR